MNITGTTINGYFLNAFIDSGGFGAVYKAEKDGKTYAIKIFREDYVLKEFRQRGDKNRIQREITILKAVNHPYLIKYVDDFTLISQSIPSIFLVMEFAEGRTLREILDTQGPFEEQQALNIFSKILYGTQHLHNIRGDDEDKGIIHRDLHPKNIIIDVAGHIKIIDYGLSKIIDYSSITKTGDILGFPPYMSPEQITDSKNIDKRSDLYTLGVVLYEMLTGKFPYEFSNFPELVDRIKNQPPTPPRIHRPSISNRLENIILKLLEKELYQRFTKIEMLVHSIKQDEIKLTEKEYDISPKFYSILWNEKGILEEYLKSNKSPLNVILPAHHQFRQKWMFQLDRMGIFHKMVDPSTIRLAYGTYTNTKGLTKLPYAPSNFQVITPSYLQNYKKQKQYVEAVLSEQLKLGADALLSPFHYTHNTTVLPLSQRNPVAEWFDLDMKLLKESIDYRNEKAPDKEIYAGICLNGESLNDPLNKRTVLNHFSAFECDGYLFFVDGIERDTSQATLYNYLDTLIKLQASTGKPVIAVRINIGLGLGILCTGVSAFSMGTSRFESFTENLYKEPSEPYNLYERYYFPNLLSTIAIERKNPTKLAAINDTIGPCQCSYCKGKSAIEVIKNHNSKLHFLHMVNKELQNIIDLPDLKSRLNYFLERIDTAKKTYRQLTGVFTSQDSTYLNNWEKVFNDLLRRN
jgi:serine/threonine-protein kinase